MVGDLDGVGDILVMVLEVMVDLVDSMEDTIAAQLSITNIIYTMKQPTMTMT